MEYWYTLLLQQFEFGGSVILIEQVKSTII